jgi:hypothetical protein
MFGWFSSDKNKKEQSENIDVENSSSSDISQDSSDEVIDIFFSNTPPPLSWKDSQTGLIWEVKNRDNYDLTFTYNEALEYAKNLNIKFYDGSSKWRVPTIDELMSLGSDKLFDYRNKSSKYQTRASWKEKIEHTRNGKLFVKKPFSDFMAKQVESWYWSSTEVGDYQKNLTETKIKRFTETAWAVDFFEGGNYHNGKHEKNSVICVRNL